LQCRTTIPVTREGMHRWKVWHPLHCRIKWQFFKKLFHCTCVYTKIKSKYEQLNFINDNYKHDKVNNIGKSMKQQTCFVLFSNSTLVDKSHILTQNHENTLTGCYVTQ
jgi:hypothetical protein